MHKVHPLLALVSTAQLRPCRRYTDCNTALPSGLQLSVLSCCRSTKKSVLVEASYRQQQQWRQEQQQQTVNNMH